MLSNKHHPIESVLIIPTGILFLRQDAAEFLYGFASLKLTLIFPVNTFMSLKHQCKETLEHGSCLGFFASAVCNE